MSNANPEISVSSYYDAVANHYHEQYQREKLYDTSRGYPANYFRLQLLLNSFITKGVKRIIEVGVGEGTPLATLGKTGIDVWGFDISQEMVKKSKRTMQENNMNPDHIFWGDVQDPNTYVQALKGGLFDGLMAMGVMPHVENDDMVIKNMSTMIRPGGSVFIEFRNKLFSLFTFNRYTVDFILNDLLRDVSLEVRAMVAKDLESRLRIDIPPRLNTIPGSDAPGYDAILSKFHNPFEVVELFEKHDFEDIQLLWYHYHPAMPYLEEQLPELFRKEAVRLEHEPSHWRGYFLCSAFVVEAVKKGK
ncbi:MAG: methyltransferase [Acidobacteria bacterium RIFCSPLOWO2_02_FULL_61_28]|nr:MAG: methyltransferase [Acidobacteria bacterium RIFCSPLOWO2_02_FULL_61_28]